MKMWKKVECDEKAQSAGWLDGLWERLVLVEGGRSGAQRVDYQKGEGSITVRPKLALSYSSCGNCKLRYI